MPSLFGGSLWGGGAGVTAPVTGVPTSNLIYHAMRLAGITLDPGNTPSSDQYADGLMALNRLIGSMNLFRNNIFTLEIDPWTLTANVQNYQLGPTATAGTLATAAGTVPVAAFVGVRPQRIERAKLLLQTTPTTVYKELNVLTGDQWLDKPVLAVTTIPEDVYIDDANPNRNLCFYPLPDYPYPIEFYSWQSLAKPVSIATLLAYPDGYEQALVDQMTPKFAAMWRKPVTADMRLSATLSLAAIQGFNAPTPRLHTEPGLSGRPGGLYNYLTGQVEP